MSEKLTLQTYKDRYGELDTEALQAEYQDVFNEAPMVDGEPTNDRATLIRKLAYAKLLAAYEEEGEEVPNRVATFSQKAFDAPFKAGGSAGGGGKARTGTIQSFIVDRLHGLVQRGESMTVEDLAAEVVEAFPGSTYKNAPIARMKTDINKYNKGLFNYGVEHGKVPANESEYFHPIKPEPVPASTDDE